MENSFLFDHPGLETGYFYIFTHTHIINCCYCNLPQNTNKTKQNQIIRIVNYALMKPRRRDCIPADHFYSYCTVFESLFADLFESAVHHLMEPTTH